MDTQALAGFDLFADLTEDHVSRLSELFTEHRVLMGEQLTKKDDFGYSFFLVRGGQLRVQIDGTDVAQFGAGDHFGEMALVRGDRRNATVTASETCRVAKTMAWDFSDLVESYPVLAQRLEAVAAERDA